jgi:HEAT repeat protein
LLEALNDENKDVRREAASALGQIGRTAPEALTSVPKLINALLDKDETVRQTAAEALGRMGPMAKSAVPALVKALDDPNDLVRKGAGSALMAIDREAATKAGLRWPNGHVPGKGPFPTAPVSPERRPS